MLLSTKCSYLNMKLLHFIFALLMSFLAIEEISADLKEIRLIMNKPRAPLGLIKVKNSQLYKLAIPHGYETFKDKLLAKYFYDDTEEEFHAACADTDTVVKNNYKTASRHPRIYFLENYRNQIMFCTFDINPWIRVTEERCTQFGDTFYQVGYPIWNPDKKTTQFLYTYKACYSTTDGTGTLYTVHRIESPSLLFLKWTEFYAPSLARSFENFKSSLDYDVKKKVHSAKKDYYLYEFVGRYDMPTSLWRYTTSFLINYTPISEDVSVLKGMIRIDNYIRLYSKVTNSPLTLYSGTLETSIIQETTGCLGNVCELKIPLNLFWRIIIDDRNNAVIIVTQHTLLKCDSSADICHENFVLLRDYRNGGCSYMCSVDNDVIETLGLKSQSLNIEGHLDLRFAKSSSSSLKQYEIISSQGAEDKFEWNTDVESEPKPYVDILDFMNDKNFMTALIKADPKLENIIGSIIKTDGEDDSVTLESIKNEDVDDEIRESADEKKKK